MFKNHMWILLYVIYLFMIYFILFYVNVTLDQIHNKVCELCDSILFSNIISMLNKKSRVKLNIQLMCKFTLPVTSSLTTSSRPRPLQL